MNTTSSSKAKNKIMTDSRSKVSQMDKGSNMIQKNDIIKDSRIAEKKDYRIMDRMIFLEPDRVLDEAKNRKQQLESCLEDLELRIQTAPEGSLRITSSGATRTHYHRKNRNDPYGQYIKKEDRSLSAALVQKGYCQKLQKNLKNQLDALNDLLANYHPSSIYDIYENLHEERKRMMSPILLSDGEYSESWLSKEYKGKPFSPDDDSEFYTDNGIRVRSKSEVLIGNELLNFGVPFRYEYPVTMTNGIVVHPDFYCLNIRNRQEIIWEHLGIMDDPHYVENSIKKLNWYFKKGFIIGENLIITFETKRNPLNTKLTKKYIELHLL